MTLAKLRTSIGDAIDRADIAQLEKTLSESSRLGSQEMLVILGENPNEDLITRAIKTKNSEVIFALVSGIQHQTLKDIYSKQVNVSMRSYLIDAVEQLGSDTFKRLLTHLIEHESRSTKIDILANLGEQIHRSDYRHEKKITIEILEFIDKEIKSSSNTVPTSALLFSEMCERSGNTGGERF